MVGKPRVKSYRPQVLMVVKDATDEELLALAFQIEAQAKVNIQGNGQIDTGFMLNSVYAAGKDGASTYQTTRPTGNYKSRKSGQSESRKRAPARKVPEKASAIVAVGAEYAIHQETRKSFLYQAMQSVADGRPGASVSTNIKKKVQAEK